jgi:hypothetical protein
MPNSTFVELPAEEQAQMLAALRRARYGYLLALHVLLLCVAGRRPTEMAAVLFGSRSKSDHRRLTHAACHPERSEGSRGVGEMLRLRLSMTEGIASPVDQCRVVRFSVYRAVWAYREKTWGLEHDDEGRLAPPVRTTVLCPPLRRTWGGLLKATSQAYGWCRTRWRCATLALTLQTKRGIAVAADPIERAFGNVYAGCTRNHQRTR